MTFSVRTFLFISLSFAAWTAPIAQGAAPLAADEIALIVNQHVPQGRELAQFYAQARGIPDGRIIELDLPTIDDMPFERYDGSVTPVVRKFLRDRGLQDKVRCLVTFYGVPLRIVDRTNGLLENSEIGRLKATQKVVLSKLVGMIEQAEKVSLQFNPKFTPASNDNEFVWLVRRLESAGQSLGMSAQSAPDPQTREKIRAAINDLTTQFTAPVILDGPLPMAVIPPTNPSTTLPVAQLVERPFDRFARSDLREQSRRMGIITFAKVLQDQIDYLTPDASGSAVDNELALLWWPPYSRTRWQPNTLNPHFKDMRAAAPVMMVTRLDAPTPQLVRDLITNSIATEKEGLHGQFVIDARGLTPKDASGKDDPFGVFDQRLRTLSDLAQAKSDLHVMLDNKSEVLPAGSERDVGLYCGWYSVRNYVPGMKFNRGAVGYHIASFELMSLHNPLETGWVHGLMSDGVVATLGPVAEPYLHSFPLPEEFFPLLLTGKLPLAQVYWTTTPLTSWMQCCIGDPLYNPFAKDPALKPQDLPEILKPAVSP